jgi:hypothetical protein
LSASGQKSINSPLPCPKMTAGLRPEIDQLAVAVSENDRRRRRARDTGGRWNIPGLDLAEARVQPRRFDSRGAEIHRCGARDHVARENHLPLHEEKQAAVGRIYQDGGSNEFEQRVHLPARDRIL